MTLLGGEPQYKIREFNEEFLGRSRLVIHEMGAQIEMLLRAMAAEFSSYRERNYAILLDGVRFEWIRWTPDGGVLIEFSEGAILPPVDPSDRERHAVIDDYVDGIVGETIPEGLRAEFSGFLRGIIMQFGLLKKQGVSLTPFVFERPHWIGDRTMRFNVKRSGRPYVPGLVRLD